MEKTKRLKKKNPLQHNALLSSCCRDLKQGADGIHRWFRWRVVITYTGSLRVQTQVLNLCHTWCLTMRWRSHDLKGQSLIPFSHTRILLTLVFFCAKQNPGPKPMQMARIWWLTSFVFLLLQGNGLFLSFTLGMNYPVVFLCLLIFTILSSSSHRNTWPGKLDALITRTWRLETLSWLRVLWLVSVDES